VDKAPFTADNTLLLHWEGKILPEIVGGKDKVYRVAILVTGSSTEKLLSIPQIGSGTGVNQANSCLHELEERRLRTQILGLVFDTISSNTGLKTCPVFGMYHT